MRQGDTLEVNRREISTRNRSQVRYEGQSNQRYWDRAVALWINVIHKTLTGTWTQRCSMFMFIKSWAAMTFEEQTGFFYSSFGHSWHPSAFQFFNSGETAWLKSRFLYDSNISSLTVSSFTVSTVITALDINLLITIVITSCPLWIYHHIFVKTGYSMMDGCNYFKWFMAIVISNKMANSREHPNETMRPFSLEINLINHKRWRSSEGLFLQRDGTPTLYTRWKWHLCHNSPIKWLNKPVKLCMRPIITLIFLNSCKLLLK